MMKKTISLMLLVAVCFFAVLTGCKKSMESEFIETTATATTAVIPTKTKIPTAIPTENSTASSTEATILYPTVVTTEATTEAPTVIPTINPTTVSTRKPTVVTQTATKPTTTKSTTVATTAPIVETTAPPTKVPTTKVTVAPTVKPTKAPTTATTQPTRPPVAPNAWKEDNTLKILAVGNSYSIDCMEYVYEIAKAAGVENVKLGNLYIAGCALDKHLNNAQYDGIGYTFYTNSEGQWESTAPYQMSTAIQSDNWDFILFQQASPVSGYAYTYDDLMPLIKIVEPLCTNENVQFGWHMTWAYKSDSTNGAFKNYGNLQSVMYSAITSAVKTKIETNPYITKIIPNGTVIQNARTSYVGDNFTRDSSDHLTKDEGRKLAGLGVVASLIEIDWDTIDLSAVITDNAFRQVAIESVRNALETPYAVTPSVITERPA